MEEFKLSMIPYKGTRDFYPEEMKLRNWFYSKIRKVLKNYVYEEYNGPMLESFDIYAAKSGVEIVNEQTYNFMDKKDRRLAIRPEMTPTVARMVAGKFEQLTMPLRWFSIPNLLRYEKPQRGRVREHWQVNVDMFGVSSLKADLEIISVAIDMMKAFGADENMFSVKISNRKFFNEVLKEVISVEDENIVSVSKVIDKKNKISESEYKKWLLDLNLKEDKIKLLDSLFDKNFYEISEMIEKDLPGKFELKELFEMIKDMGIEKYCEFDFSIIRGFDYYTGTVFEVNDKSPMNRRALFGGGRYDNLIEMFKKGANITGIGFGFGDVTLKDFLETHNLIPQSLDKTKDVLIAVFDDVPFKEYLKISSELRNNNISNIIYMGENLKFKKQIQFAGRKNISYMIILGKNELDSGEFIFKILDEKREIKMDKSNYLNELKEILK
jgi:histidyl-tRNA synthetase